MQGSGGPTAAETARQEVVELKRRNQVLTEELRRAKHQAEKPYEQQGKESTGSHVILPSSLVTVHNSTA